jgi:hypothetical protein
MLIGVAITGDRNVVKKEDQKILKYQNLTTETRRMWNVKTQVMPVIIGATGTMSKSLTKYLSNVPVSTTSRNYSKQPHWHCTRTAGSTGVKYRTLSVGNSITCNIKCNCRIAATLHTVQTCFVSGM